MKHPENTTIFNTQDYSITYGDFLKALVEIGSDECDVLFVHSDMGFGVPERGIKREELKCIMTDVLLELGVETLVFPTFTFSYCNEEDYNIQESRTAMGMLPEYIRNRPDAFRTDDPILSVAIMGNKDGIDKMTGSSSCGTGGIFHQLFTSGKKVKYLFFGTAVSKCFTFLHYVEEVKKVDYRYLRRFEGNVINDGESRKKDIDLFVRYKDVKAILPEGFEQNLEKLGISRKIEMGYSSISCVDEIGAYEYISDLIDHNHHSFCRLPESGRLVKEYEFGGVVSM